MAQENVGADALLGAVAGVAGGAVAGAVSALRAANSVMDRVTMGMAGGGTQKFEVNKDNVLKAGAAIQDCATALKDKLDLVSDDLKISASENTDGKVGADIAAAWNSRLVGGPDTYAGRVDGYVKALQRLSDQLREAAKQYGISEEEITTTFGPAK
ncbi:hypothetical protein [Lentzea sp. NPDC003310]|uniref:hypothetical protein n=1 Tax=Lentzea sp. NPDC003310 TaxID=3154447 RepID=UPI0033B028F5